MFIAILDDDERRQQTMAATLEQLQLPYDVQFFDNAPDMIPWLQEHLSQLVLISLDHDLGPNRRRQGEIFDPGTGRHVVDFLIDHLPACPVIVHSTNGYCAPGMMFALEYAKWSGHRIVPYDDVGWITQAWVKAVKEILGLQP